MSFPNRVAVWVITISVSFAGGGWLSAKAENGQFGTPKGAEGTRIFKAEEHPTYSGLFRLQGEKGTLVGSMQDRSPWDHLDYAGNHLTPVRSTILIEADERQNTGKVAVEFTEGQDTYRIVFDRFSGDSPYKDGGGRHAGV